MILLPRAAKLGYATTLGRTGGRAVYPVTEFTSSILAPTNRSWHRSRQDLRGSQIESESIFKEICCGLNACDFSHATQEHFVNVLCRMAGSF
jgi:hypothetical protein